MSTREREESDGRRLPEKRIRSLLRKHHLLTVCTTDGDEPWCASCFYAYMESENALVFTTDVDTRHGREFGLNSLVAGTIALETRIPGKIRGVQFQGRVSVAGGERLKRARRSYLKRFPYAVAMDIYLWIIDITFLKLTDNRLGFGKKLLWRADDPQGEADDGAGNRGKSKEEES